MPQPRKPAAAKPRPLPPVSPARFDEITLLIETLAEDQTDTFIAIGQGYRERHREGTKRALNAQEAAQIASAMTDAGGLPPVALAVAVQESDLYGYDEPSPGEILFRAGIATAPAAMASILRFVALMELPRVQFEEACEGGTLHDDLDGLVKAMRHEDIAGPNGVRERARRAAEHLSVEVADVPGKAVALLIRAQWQMIRQGLESLGYQRAPSSLTGSPPSTDGPGETSSMTSGTATL